MPQILVTGNSFTGSGLRAIQPVIEELLATAQSEIHAMFYLITDSAMPMLDEFERTLERAVNVTLVINNLDTPPKPVRERLFSLASKYRGFTLANFIDPHGGQLHAKAIIADRQRAVLGSANLSWGGMIGNHEIGILLEGPAAWTLANLAEMIATRWKSSTQS